MSWELGNQACAVDSRNTLWYSDASKDTSHVQYCQDLVIRNVTKSP